jgi:glycosyltransferase involved in cell wall biosynthesis
MIINNANKKTGLIIGPLPGSITGKPAPGGIATHIEGLLYYLKSNGIDAYICYHKPYSNRITWFLAVIYGMLMMSFNKKYRPLHYSIKDTVITAFYLSTLKKIISRINPDFVHIHSLHNPAPVALDIVKYKRPIIITEHGFWQSRNKNRKIMLKLTRNITIANKIVYISDMARKRQLSANLVNDSKLIKIPNPTDFSLYPIKSIKEQSEKIILFNGYGESITRKGFDILVSTINKYPELYNTIKLLAVCNKEAEDYIKKNTWNFRYELIGKTTLEKILDIYCNVDLLAVPSRSESFGLVYTEALAVGIPVIGYYEVIDEFKQALNTYIGESFNPNMESEENLKEKIIKCLNTPFDAALVRENLIKNFSWDVLGRKFIDLYYPG